MKEMDTASENSSTGTEGNPYLKPLLINSRVSCVFLKPVSLSYFQYGCAKLLPSTSPEKTALVIPVHVIGSLLADCIQFLGSGLF